MSPSVTVPQFKTSQNESKCHHASRHKQSSTGTACEGEKNREREREILKTHGAETRKTSIGFMQEGVEENR